MPVCFPPGGGHVGGLGPGLHALPQQPPASRGRPRHEVPDPRGLGGAALPLHAPPHRRAPVHPRQGHGCDEEEKRRREPHLVAFTVKAPVGLDQNEMGFFTHSRRYANHPHTACEYIVPCLSRSV